MGTYVHSFQFKIKGFSVKWFHINFNLTNISMLLLYQLLRKSSFYGIGLENGLKIKMSENLSLIGNSCKCVKPIFLTSVQ